MKLAILAIAAMLLLVPAGAFAQQQPGVSRLNIIDANYTGPVFLDAFWTDRTSPPAAGTSLEKVEVAPGDGASVLAVTLVNRGFSEITAVSGELRLPAGFTAAGTSSNVAVATHNSIVSAGSTFTLFFQVDITDKAAVRTYTAPLNVEFSRTLEVGQPRTVDMSAPFKVTGKVILDASSDGGVAPGMARKVAISITNGGSAPATGVVVTVPGSSGVNPATGQASIVSLGQKTFELGVIPPGESATIEPTIYASSTSGDTLQAMNMQLSYGNAYGVRKVANITVGMVILPESASSVVSVSPVGESSIITSGKITDLKLALANNGDQQLSDVLVSIKSQSESIKILGDTSWTVGDMDPSSSQELSTKVFASADMIGKAATLTLTVQHISVGGQPEIETIDLGTYVDGEIGVRAYEIDATYIGGIPNITGNLLNEGNVVALFTTVELVSAEGLVDQVPPQQYLGDLTENSPLPFSIPVDVPADTAAGTYPVVLKVEYKDSLKQLHTMEIESDVAFAPEASAADEAAAGQADGQMMTAVIIGVVIAVAIAAFVIMRRRKGALKRTFQYSKGNGDNIESVLDSQLRKPEERNK
ncbi:MAG: COG1361 S-layer family protein [Nitrososphaera sp.]|uniref:COG1361 S-layer family protein n=1 Tax=Nitrososphaera sp. TaxID=1971748 RepID=UPI003D6FE964